VREKVCRLISSLREEEQRVGDLKAAALDLLAQVEELEQKRIESDEELARLRQNEVLLQEEVRILHDQARDQEREQDQAAIETKQLRAELAAQRATVTRLECSLQSFQSVPLMPVPSWEKQIVEKNTGEKQLVEVLEASVGKEQDASRDVQVQEKMVRAWTVDSTGSADRFGTPTRGRESDVYQAVPESPTSSTSPSSFGISPVPSPISQRARSTTNRGAATSFVQPVGVDYMSATIVEE
jgi:hypothetical protein